ncbi:hypothetical protein BGW39_005499 [Mortierella sp. 14UC]|nr:hypothetical protein BGW39_005499 [Mortierella sp. 14UC]
MKFTIAALSTLAFASQAAAQLIAYSAPIGATIWTAGSPATISWTNSCNLVEGNTTFPVYLNQQVGQYQVQVPGLPELGYLDCKKAGKITIQVPVNITQGNNYSILVTNGGNQSYSALFTIQSNITGPVTTTTTTLLPTTVAPTTSTVASTVTTPPSPSGTLNNNAAVLKAGSQAALVIVAAVASMML